MKFKAVIRAAALQFGAHFCIDTKVEDAAERLVLMGGASAIMSTIGDAAASLPCFPVLHRVGRWCRWAPRRIR